MMFVKRLQQFRNPSVKKKDSHITHMFKFQGFHPWLQQLKIIKTRPIIP